MACVGWVRLAERMGQELAQFPHLKRWFETVRARPAVKRAFAIRVEAASAPSPRGGPARLSSSWGERSDGLIAQLRQQGVPVILLSGSFEFPASSSLAGTTILEKPVSETHLLLTWAHLLPEPEATRGDDNGASAEGKLLKFCRRQLSVAHRILELAMAKVCLAELARSCI
jgi:hypothetical protein